MPGAADDPIELRLGVVTATRVVGGRVMVDAIAPASVDSWKDLALVVAGGGPGQYRFAGVAGQAEANTDPSETTGAQVLVVITREGRYAMACVQHPKSTFVEETDALEQTEDHDGQVAKADIADANGGATVLLTSRGAFVVDVAGAEDGNVRLQLADAGVVRISRAGKADERLVLAGPLVDYLQKVDGYLKSLESWAKALTVDTSTGAGVTKGSGKPIGPFTDSPPELTSDAMKAAAIHVSADDEVSA